MSMFRELPALREAIRAGGGRVFQSPKAARPLPAASDLMFDALVQFALDPLVRAITCAPAAAGSVEGVDAFVSVRADVSTLVCVLAPDARRGWLAVLGRAAQAGGLSILPLDRSDLSIQPLASNCRTIWSCRGHRVEPGDRYRIVSLLREEMRLPLTEVCREVRSGADPVRVLAALACADVLALDLASEPLGPGTAISLCTQVGR